jgi:hypothetical protein
MSLGRRSLLFAPISTGARLIVEWCSTPQIVETRFADFRSAGTGHHKSLDVMIYVVRYPHCPQSRGK